MGFDSWGMSRGDRFAVINPSVNAPSAKVEPVREQDCKVTFTVPISRELAKLPRRGPEINDRAYAGGAAVAAVRLLAEYYGVVAAAGPVVDYESELRTLRERLAGAEAEIQRVVTDKNREAFTVPDPSLQPQTPPTDNPAVEAGPQSVTRKRKPKAKVAE